MKKKTFGRVAAIGLAGLTAVPAISIVASASVSFDMNTNDGTYSISGTAHVMKWLVTEVKTTYTAVENADGTINYSVNVTSQETRKNLDTENATFGSPAVPANGSNYYTNQKAATTEKTNIDNAISAAKTQAENEKKAFDNAISDYTKYTTNLAKAQNADVSAKDYVATYTDSKGATITVTKAQGTTSVLFSSSAGTFTTPTKTFTTPLEVTTYEYAITPNTTTTISMKELADIFGKSVKISGEKIYSNTADNPGTEYTINTTGSGTTSGTTGSYGQYEIPYGYRTASTLSYSVDGITWYPNASALYVATGYTAYAYTKTPNPGYSSTYCWFDPTTGNYITYSQYLSGNFPYAVQVTSGTTSTDEYGIYRVSPSGLYYYTYSSALAAAGNDASRITGPSRTFSSLSAQGNYFSRVTGNFYSTYENALYYSNNNSAYVVTINATAGDYSYYDDPYYYYFLNRNSSSSSSSSSSSLGGSSVTIGNKSGWTNVRTSIRNAAAGATLNVSLGSETSIPSEILTALDAKNNVTVNFTLKNGAVISFNSSDISSPKTINVGVVYNTYNISSSLINKAKTVNNAVSSAQISIDNNTFGGSASLTVKFNASRSGYKAKIYRYNASRNSLQLVDTSTVTGSGKVTFNKVTQGGEYVIVLY